MYGFRRTLPLLAVLLTPVAVLHSSSDSGAQSTQDGEIVQPAGSASLPFSHEDPIAARVADFVEEVQIPAGEVNQAVADIAGPFGGAWLSFENNEHVVQVAEGIPQDLLDLVLEVVLVDEFRRVEIVTYGHFDLRNAIEPLLPLIEQSTTIESAYVDHSANVVVVTGPDSVGARTAVEELALPDLAIYRFVEEDGDSQDHSLALGPARIGDHPPVVGVARV